MKSRTKLGIITLIVLGLLVGVLRLLGIHSGSGNLASPNLKLDFSKTFAFEFRSKDLSKLIQKDIQGQTGDFAIYIENLTTGEKYSYKQSEIFPAASLYKLILLAAVLKEVEGGQLKLDDVLTSTKSHLTNVLGEEDFGYEDMPENIKFTVQEALERVGRISDNFAAIMLTEKLRQIREARAGDNKLLIQMAQDLGMNSTSFDNDPINTTALDIANYFKLLYKGEVVSKGVSDKIIELLLLSNLDDRIPAKLPDGLKIVHKTGELAMVRHDAGVVYIESSPYVIVLLSKNLQYEDDGVETLAQISKDVYDYFMEQSSKK